MTHLRRKSRQVTEKIGGASRDRTDDLIVANDGVCQIISLTHLHLAAEYGPLRSSSKFTAAGFASKLRREHRREING
jgi:hypothetical protein